MRVSMHATIRYIERVLGYDFTELKVEYSILHGLPSCRFSTEKPEFIRWINQRVFLQAFTERLRDFVYSNIDDKLKNCLDKSKNADHKVIIDNVKYVFKSDTLVTIIVLKDEENVK